MTEMLRKKINAAIDAFSDERIRWFMGKSRHFIDSGIIDEKTLDGIVYKLILDEIERHLILREIENSGNLTVKELEKLTGMSAEKIREHIKVLVFLDEVSLVGEKEGEPSYALSPSMKEERRRCPCETVIKLLLKEAGVLTKAK